MTKCVFLTLTAALLVVVPLAKAQVEGRFGFEYNETEPWDDPKHHVLLSKLQKVMDGGDINVNVLGGGWIGMQPDPDSAIDFSETDNIVQLFGRYGFSVAWYFIPNATWAFPNKPDCQPDTILGVPIPAKHCAPEPTFEQHWIDYVKAVVERYDDDGVDDMPGLQRPIRHYIMTGEIVFNNKGQGDAKWGPFWLDTINNLLHFHRITYQAVREADPTGNSKVVSSGAVLWDLYADFPDWPEFDPTDRNSNIQKRLNGENYRGSTYTAGWDSLKKMLDSFGDDADGIECDYVGWHPHFSWRVIDQEFALIHAHAGDLPIYVDDMWMNLFASGYFRPYLGNVPGAAQFNAPANAFAGTDWVKRINGDFPNPLFTTINPYDELNQELSNGNLAVLDWYYANGARRLVKSLASAFGEGAVVACFSGSNDISKDMPIWGPLVGRGTALGWINLTGTREEDYLEKPQYYTYKLLAEKLHDFTRAAEIRVSSDPRTRAYEFDRPGRGPVYVLWSETGEAPLDLNYRNPSGETVTLKVANDANELILTHIITDTVNTEPDVEMIPTQNGLLTIQLGYQPIFLEGDFLVDVKSHSQSSIPSSFELAQNYPNPFNPATTIEYRLPRAAHVTLRIYNLMGQEVQTLAHEEHQPGVYKIEWDGSNHHGQAVATGLYVVRMVAGDFTKSKKILLLR